MPRKHDNIFPQRKSILFSCNDWIPTMTTTISSMWSAKVNLQYSNRSEETQLSSHRPSAPTCPATHAGQFRRHGIFLLLQSPRCYHRMQRETLNYIHHVTALTFAKASIASFWSFSLPNVPFATKIAPTCTAKCAFRHSFSPQPRRIVEHQNVQKCSEDYSFWTFWLSNVLFATAACNFSTSEQTKVLQTRHVLHILTCKCAFRHSARQFFDSRTSKNSITYTTSLPWPSPERA